jgi:hypothetical protein
MSVNQNKGDSLEQFFRKKAGEYDVSYREDDWRKLETELNLRDIKNAYRRKIWLIAAASMLILSLLGYFTYENRLGLNEIRQQISEEINPDLDAGVTPDPGDPPRTGDNPSLADRESRSETDFGQSANESHQPGRGETIPKEEILRNGESSRNFAGTEPGEPGSRPSHAGSETLAHQRPDDNSESGERGAVRTSGNDNDRRDNAEDAEEVREYIRSSSPADFAEYRTMDRSDQLRVVSGVIQAGMDIPPVTYPSVASLQQPESGSVSGTSTDETSGTGNLAVITHDENEDPGSNAGTGIIPESPENILASADPVSDRPAWNSASRFSVGLVISPDMSTAGSLSNFSKPGYKIGFSIDYNITRNLVLSSGMIRSLVRYSAPGGAYNLPVNYNGGTRPDEISGECIILDIPVTLRYHVLNFNRSRLFISTGLSSYIMLSEDYAFSTYQYGYREDQVFSERTGTRHWMSNAGFSAGYELDLMRNLTLRAEPFVRIPVSRVGWADVNLYSVGTFLSVSYRL